MSITDEASARVAGRRRARPLNRDMRIPFGDPVYFSAMDFLIQEARLLDQDRLVDWRDLLAPDIFYYMSQQRTLERGQARFDTGSYWYYENFDTLDLRIRKFLVAKSAFAEDPPSRIRRYVGNLTLFTTADPDEFVAESYLQLLRNRGDAPDYETLSCGRDDILRRDGDGWSIAQRHIMVDQAVLGTHNLSFFL